MIKKNTIPTILGVVILILGTFAGVFFLRNSQVFKIGADASVSPKNIRVGNVSDNSVTLSWTTDKGTIDFAVWGASAGNLDKTIEENSNGQSYLNHSLTISGLSPKTTYFYKINSNGVAFDNGGIPWQFTTGPAISTGKSSILISGTVINASGQPEKQALVYADIGGYLLSTLTSDTGNFVFQLGSARTTDLLNFAQIDPTSTLIQISVEANPDGIASAQIYPQSSNPIPPIIIGQTYDFRSNTANNQGSNPNANLNLPIDNSQQSKFNIATSSSTPKPTSVILESLTEGETVTSTQPEFFGKGPNGTTLTITVHSQNPVSGTLQIPKTGSWSYAVPTNLTPGQHTVTISWIDVSGITRFLTRDFIVQAGEVPAFTASQSGSTPSPKPTLGPSPVATETAMPVPVTGDIMPTLLLSIMGVFVVTFSFYIWKFSNNA